MTTYISAKVSTNAPAEAGNNVQTQKQKDRNMGRASTKNKVPSFRRVPKSKLGIFYPGMPAIDRTVLVGGLILDQFDLLPNVYFEIDNLHDGFSVQILVKQGSQSAFVIKRSEAFKFMGVQAFVNDDIEVMTYLSMVAEQIAFLFYQKNMIGDKQLLEFVRRNHLIRTQIGYMD